MSKDTENLFEQQIFKDVCNGFPKDINKPLNLVAVRESLLFTWDFQNNCILAVNIQPQSGLNKNMVVFQKLLPIRPLLFSPTYLIVNEIVTLAVVAGTNGILVVELPPRIPPPSFGYRDKPEVLQCKCYSLDERLLFYGDTIEVRQIKFHPGSLTNSHILALTSDNMLRFYQIQNSKAINLATYAVGEKPSGMFPGSKISFLDIYGETAVDFDFGLPEIMPEKEKTEVITLTTPKKLIQMQLPNSPSTKGADWERIRKNRKAKSPPISSSGRAGGSNKSINPQNKSNEKYNFQNNWNLEELVRWPIYILRGNYSVYSIYLHPRQEALLEGPYPVHGQPDRIESDACSIICPKTIPQIISIASTTGAVINSILLNIDNDEDYDQGSKEYQPKKDIDSNNTKRLIKLEPVNKELLVFEIIELYLGLNIVDDSNNDSEDSKRYKCPIFLHKDDSLTSRIFATHNGGIHSINIGCVEELEKYIFGPKDTDPSSDIFAYSSSIEYLVCSKTLSSDTCNPVIGFSLYYNPTSLIAILKNGNVVNLNLLTANVALINEDLLDVSQNLEETLQISAKKMQSVPFDQYILKLVKKASNQPVLRLSSACTIEEWYCVIQSVAKSFREEKFKYLTQAREEIEKRMYALNVLQNTQKCDLDKLIQMKEKVRNEAENLAEKHEDIKDKQDDLLKRCERLLILISQKKSEPSHAEKQFLKDLQRHHQTCEIQKKSIENLKNKIKYQQLQIGNWKCVDTDTEILSELQSKTIRNSLKESTKKIDQLITDIHECKQILHI